MTTTIQLRGMRFHAPIGYLEEERLNGNDILVDVICHCAFQSAILSDRLEDTLDYAILYGIIREEVGKPSRLLEHVTGRILNRLMASSAAILEIEVSVAKADPPLGGEVRESRITVSLSREDWNRLF